MATFASLTQRKIACETNSGPLSEPGTFGSTNAHELLAWREPGYPVRPGLMLGVLRRQQKCYQRLPWCSRSQLWSEEWLDLPVVRDERRQNGFGPY